MHQYGGAANYTVLYCKYKIRETLIRAIIGAANIIVPIPWWNSASCPHRVYCTYRIEMK
jgi:hypothetical protein